MEDIRIEGRCGFSSDEQVIYPSKATNIRTAADVDDMRYTSLGWRREVEVDEDDAEEALREKESTSGGGSNIYAFLDDLKLLFLFPPSMYMLFKSYFVLDTISKNDAPKKESIEW
ncbi:hypothetical protein Dimus_019938 [Dionaea muscipula]